MTGRRERSYSLSPTAEWMEWEAEGRGGIAGPSARNPCSNTCHSTRMPGLRAMPTILILPGSDLSIE